MNRAQRIESRISEAFPDREAFELTDLSHQHAGRAGTESHFQLLLVSTGFEGQSRVQRQRQINQLLNDEFQQGLHALTMRLLTPEEKKQQNSPFKAPDCQGGE